MACVAEEILATLEDACEHVPTVESSELNASQFVEQYMVPNQPVLIMGLTSGWRAQREWVSGASGDGEQAASGGETVGVPDVGGAMAEAFGGAEVLVVDCDAPLDTDLARVSMTFKDYAQWWTSRDGRRLYLKDWTFASDYPEYGAYDTPPHFADDWLNAYWDERSGEDSTTAAATDGDGEGEGDFEEPEVLKEAKKEEGDACAAPAPGVAAGVSDNGEGGGEREKAHAVYEEEGEGGDDAAAADARDGGGTHRFVYAGVAGTWTPLHADILRSFSWSVNIAGNKRWLMAWIRDVPASMSRGRGRGRGVAGEGGREHPTKYESLIASASHVTVTVPTDAPSSLPRHGHTSAAVSVYETSTGTRRTIFHFGYYMWIYQMCETEAAGGVTVYRTSIAQPQNVIQVFTYIV